jgi:hypothetical protein
MDAQLQAWHASKRALQAGQQQQEASLATHRNEIRLKMVREGVWLSLAGLKS